MAYRIIDDETALTIFEAIQETSTRSFARYNCLRQLPKHKISGELMFYLDELIEFAERELEQEPSESLGQVVDLGLTAWLAGLNPAFQRKLGFSLNEREAPSVSTPAESSEKNAAAEGETDTSDLKSVLKLLTQKKKAVEELTAANKQLQDTVEALAAEKVALKREIAHLEQVNEELSDQSPQVQTQAMQGYLADTGPQSGYMALTTHSLTVTATNAADKNQASSSKKNKRRRKKKNVGVASRPQ